MRSIEDIFWEIAIVRVGKNDSMKRVWEKIKIRLTHIEILRRYIVFSN